MIFVDREKMTEPEVFRSPRIKKLRKEAREYFGSMKTSQGESQFNWDMSWYREIRDPLRKLFHDKCAFCESRLYGEGDIELFRPKSRSMNLDGKIDEGYWWLAHEWQNMYLVCQVCNQRYKRNRFPVKNRRAKNLAGLDREQALLIDPCRAQDFEMQHFTFVSSDDGWSVDMVPLTDRGEITIEILGMNHETLRSARSSELIQINDLLTNIAKYRSKNTLLLEALEKALSTDEPFLSMKQQLVREFATNDVSLQEAFPSIMENYRLFPEPETSQAEVEQILTNKMTEQTAYSVLENSETDKERYFSGLKDIEKVQIKNFRILRDIDLDFTHTSGTEEASWMTLIGENSTGKSSVLQAIALTLLGDEERRKLEAHPEEYITHGEAESRIDVHLTNIAQPISLTIKRDPPLFECNVHDPLVLLLGYGSTRLLRRFSEDTEKERQLIRINNLFDPYQKLNHVEKWLGDTDAVLTPKFNMIREALMNLLPLESGTDVIRRRNGRVYVKLNNERYHLGELSDGYQSVLALALDIMRVLTEKWESIRDAEGIVLIDELGVHLHPRWKMEITTRLMRTFPGLQFIATTHEPLCLRGLGEGQVILMRRNEESGKVEAVSELPSPAEFRVDQLLTSSFFGLNSTMDQETEGLFNEYYMLLALKKPNSVQRRRIKVLKTQLQDQQHLGSTPRDQIMYEVIDRLLAQNKYQQLDRPIGEIEEEAVEQIAALWQANFEDR